MSATLGQVMKVLGMLSDVPQEQVQALLSSDLFPDFLKANVGEINREEFQKVIGLKASTTLVDGDLPRDQVLALGGFKYVDPALTDGTFPLDGENKPSGQWEIAPELTQVGCCRNAAEVLQKLKEKGIRPLTPREFCFYLKNNPDKARDKVIGLPGVQVKDRDGVQCSAYFNGRGGRWGLGLGGVGDEWGGGWWVVGVRESAPQGAQD